MSLPPVMPTRLEQLRAMRDWFDSEIAREMGGPASEVIDTVAEFYGVSRHQILGRSQARSITVARHAAAWLLRRQGKSFQDIGATLGFDHSSAYYAYHKVERSTGARALARELESKVG